MTDDLDRVIAAVKELGLHPNIRNYESRFIVQKVAYLLQALGMPLAYTFTIHIAGPYSRQLGTEYYQEKGKIKSLETSCRLTPTELEATQKIKRAFGQFNDPNLLECASTMVYFMRQEPEITDDAILTKIRSIKHHLSDSTRTIGLTKAKQLLFRPEFVTDDLRKEMEEWDRIDS